MQNMNAGTADFTRLAKNITKIGSIDTIGVNNIATSLSAIARRLIALEQFRKWHKRSENLLSAIGKLGYKSVENL